MQLIEPPRAVCASSPTYRRAIGTKLPVIFIAAILALPAPAQNNPPGTQSTYDPGSGPGAGQKFLEKFAGNWDVKKIFHPRTGDPVIAKGECHQKMINDGRFLQSEFVFYNVQTNTTGIGLTGFDPASGLFTSVWADSRSTKMSIRQSKVPFDGNEIVLFSVPLTNGVREARPSRDVTRLTDNDRKIIHQQYAINPDKTERLMLELILTQRSQ